MYTLASLSGPAQQTASEILIGLCRTSITLYATCISLWTFFQSFSFWRTCSYQGFLYLHGHI